MLWVFFFFFPLIMPSPRCWLTARQAESQADKASWPSTSFCSFLQPHPNTPVSHIEPSCGLGQVSAMGWRDRVGWGDNKGGAQVDNLSREPWGAPCKLPMNPHTPRGDAVISAGLYGHEQSNPPLCPSSRSAFPGAEGSAAALALGCHHLLMVLSADPLSSSHLSHSFDPSCRLGRGANGGEEEMEKNLCQPCSSCTPRGCPHGVQVPPVPHRVLLTLHGIALGLS